MKKFTHILVSLLLAAALLLLSAPALHAQQKKVVTGTVTDKEGALLVGVTVLVKGTSVGTTTQGDGRYELEIPAGGEVLQFSFLGMDTQEAAIGSRTAIDVSLASSTTGIDEVVVVGYGTVSYTHLTLPTICSV